MDKEETGHSTEPAINYSRNGTPAFLIRKRWQKQTLGDIMATAETVSKLFAVENDVRCSIKRTSIQ
jgi:hypothetical protein